MPYTWERSASMEDLPERPGHSQLGPPSFDIERPLPPEAPGITHSFHCSPKRIATSLGPESEPRPSLQVRLSPHGGGLLPTSRATAFESTQEDPAVRPADECPDDKRESDAQKDEQKALPASQPTLAEDLGYDPFGVSQYPQQKEPNQPSRSAESLEQFNEENCDLLDHGNSPDIPMTPKQPKIEAAIPGAPKQAKRAGSRLMPSLVAGSLGTSPHAEKEKPLQVSLALCFEQQRAHTFTTVRITVHDPDYASEWTDTKLFQTIRKTYHSELQGRARRIFSLKSLKAIHLLHYSDMLQPKRVVLADDFDEHHLMFGIRNPRQVDSKRVWIDWVFKLKADPRNRYALEFVEDWDGARIVALGSGILVSIVFASCLWAGLGGDLQTVFTITGFALAVCTAFVALLAIYSQTDR